MALLSHKNKYYFYIFFVAISILTVTGCIEIEPAHEDEFAQLSQNEKDYIERFNVIVKNIRDFHPIKNGVLENYFYIYKNVPDIRDAKYLLFGEWHTNSANQLWTAGVVNELITDGDMVLFEGNQGGAPVLEIDDYMLRHVFAAREYELRMLEANYQAKSLSKITKLFSSLHQKTKKFLAHNLLKLRRGKGAYWDLLEKGKLNKDDSLRNEMMVETMKYTGSFKRTIVIAGAMHIPHFEFAMAINYINQYPMLKAAYLNYGASLIDINKAHYEYFGKVISEYGKTKSIFEFLQSVEFAVLIPKNLNYLDRIRDHLPTNNY